MSCNRLELEHLFPLMRDTFLCGPPGHAITRLGLGGCPSRSCYTRLFAWALQYACVSSSLSGPVWLPCGTQRAGRVCTP